MTPDAKNTPLDCQVIGPCTYLVEELKSLLPKYKRNTGLGRP